MKNLFYILCAICFLSVFSNAHALTITEQDVIGAIHSESQEQDVEFEIFSGQTNFNTETGAQYKLLVSKLKLDELQDKFACLLEVFIDNQPYATTPIMGRFYRLSEVYVPSSDIEKGKVISKDMLKAVKVRANKVKNIHVINDEDLIGNQAKKTLVADKFVQNKDIERPILVKKNEKVLVFYKTSNMQIGMKAIAMDDGAKGDFIELINPSSKKSLTGQVVDKNTVIIEGEK